jgi:hypothetical protein
MIITTPAILNGFRTLLDGTMRLTVDLNELESDKLAQLLSMLNEYGLFSFVNNSTLSDEEKEYLASLDEATKEDDKSKSQSKRLRNVLFLVHKESGGDQSSFEEYYKNETERIINHYKAKLPDGS